MCPRAPILHVPRCGRLNPTTVRPCPRRRISKIRGTLLGQFAASCLVRPPSTRRALTLRSSFPNSQSVDRCRRGYPLPCKWPTLDVGQLYKGPRRSATVTTHRRHHHRLRHRRYHHLPTLSRRRGVCRIAHRRRHSAAVTLDTSDFARNGYRPRRKGNVLRFIIITSPPSRLSRFAQGPGACPPDWTRPRKRVRRCRIRFKGLRFFFFRPVPSSRT